MRSTARKWQGEASIISVSHPRWLKDRRQNYLLKHRKLIRWFITPTDIGANASAEEADDGLEESSKQVIDVVDGFRLNFLGDEESGSRAFKTKKDYLTQLKGRFANQSSFTLKPFSCPRQI